MKNKLLILLCSILLLACPTLAKEEPTIILNGLHYTAKDATYIEESILYLSPEDLKNLTYGELIQTKKGVQLKIQNNIFELNPNDRFIKIDGMVKIASHPPLLKNRKLYIPITILDYIDYPYEVDSSQNTWSIHTIQPYSTSTDTFDNHTLYPAPRKDLDRTLPKLFAQDIAFSALSTSKQMSSYISFIDTLDKTYILKPIHTDLIKRKPMRVAFRNVDLLSPQHEISDFNSLPLVLKAEKDKLCITLGDKQIDANALWTTYPSDTRLNQLDITKTIDATLMQSLYTYYRDHLDLKDDLFTSPIQFIQKGSSDHLLHTVYWDNVSGQNTNYEVVIYKNIGPDFITYYVDLRLKKSNS